MWSGMSGRSAGPPAAPRGFPLERFQATWNRDGAMGFAALYPSYQLARTRNSVGSVGWVERSETHRGKGSFRPV
jgi:hypothetical protein